MSHVFVFVFRLNYSSIVCVHVIRIQIEEFSKVTAAKEKDRTSVKFQDKTTNSQKFRTKLRTALPKSPDLTCQLTSLTFGTKVRTLYKTTNSQARFT